VIQGVSEAAQTVSFKEMSNSSTASPIILKDPAVANLSSLSDRRHQHHLEQRAYSDQPEALEERKISASDVIRRMQPDLAKVAGITLFMQAGAGSVGRRPGSRTQFQTRSKTPTWMS